jgi:hypothetical protein
VKQPQGSAVTLRRRDETDPVFRRRRPIVPARAGALFCRLKQARMAAVQPGDGVVRARWNTGGRRPKRLRGREPQRLDRPATARNVAALPCPSITQPAAFWTPSACHGARDRWRQPYELCAWRLYPFRGCHRHLPARRRYAVTRPGAQRVDQRATVSSLS